MKTINMFAVVAVSTLAIAMATASFAADKAEIKLQRFFGACDADFGANTSPYASCGALGTNEVYLGGSATPGGATGQDFAFVSGGTCTVGVSYNPGDSCTVLYSSRRRRRERVMEPSSSMTARPRCRQPST